MDLCFNEVNVVQGDNQILQNVSGKASPGQLLAIMGPSGAGKTTFLNALAGRIPCKGHITYGGVQINKSMKREMCYVLQQDIFFSNLTLRQTLEFTAMVRLPDSMTRKEKMIRMAQVCDNLDLTGCLDTVMGGMFTPGLSGGQKKRASIACELLRDPDLIFLDEPTTGLDSSTASSLIALLKQYAAKAGKTIIASIHQPSSHSFSQFDKLLLLSEGQVAYFGETSRVVEHFERAGVEIDTNLNPADFILDALSESEEIKQKLIAAVSTHRDKSHYQNHQQESLQAISKGQTSVFSRMKAVFNRNNPKTEMMDKVSPFEDLDAGSVTMSLLDMAAMNSDPASDQDARWPTGFLTQYTQLTKRAFFESRKRILDFIKILENLMVCVFVSLIFIQIPQEEATLRDRMGALFFLAAHWGFTPLFDAVASFPLEQIVINKERAAGWFRLSAYYFAKMTAELPLILIQPTVFIVVAYWTIGLNGVSAFFSTLGTVYINAIAGQSIGLFIGIACPQVNQAMTISISLQMAIMLLGGLFTRNIPAWLDWAKYLSFLHYAYHSLLYLEFIDAEPFMCLMPRNSSAFTVCREDNVTAIPSKVVLQYYNVDWPYWQYIFPLLVIILAFRTLGYLTLRFVRKPV